MTPRARSQHHAMCAAKLANTLALSACFICTAIGCDTPTRAKHEIEAYSWWARDSEKNAFDNVLQAYDDAHTDSEVRPAQDDNADVARARLTARLLAGAPPSTFQANIGADVLRWTVVDTTYMKVPSSSRIVSLSQFFKQNKLADVLPAALNDALVAGPMAEPYTIPIDIHRLNVLYYNKASLAAFSARNPGQSFLDKNALCPPNVAALLADPRAKLEAKIAVGTKDTFTVTLFAFESMLPAVAGAKFYDSLFRGQPPSGWETQVETALRCVQYLSRSFLPDGGTWFDALAQVQAGTADFTVMGDWSNGEAKSALQPDGTMDALTFPGSEQAFVFTSDTFPLPVHAPYRTETEDLLGVIASRPVQLAFSQDKGSIPARTDVDVTELGERAVNTKRDFDSPDVEKVLATSGLLPPYFPSDKLDAALKTMTLPGASQPEIDDVIALLRNTMPLLTRWQDRITGAPPSPP